MREDELGQNPNCADKKDACCPISANQGSEHWASIGNMQLIFISENILNPLFQNILSSQTYWSVR